MNLWLVAAISCLVGLALGLALLQFWAHWEPLTRFIRGLRLRISSMKGQKTDIKPETPSEIFNSETSESKTFPKNSTGSDTNTTTTSPPILTEVYNGKSTNTSATATAHN